MNYLRISLLLIALQAVFLSGARSAVKISESVSTQHLSELARINPDLLSLDLSEARIEGNLIPAGAFAGTALNTLMLPSTGSITIGEGAFMGTAITELVVPNSIKEIGAGAFAACKNLNYVSISGCKIGDYAFHLCSNILWVELGNSTAIGSHAFAGCVSLQKITQNGTLTGVGDFAFAHTGLIQVRLADCKNLLEVGSWAFANDSSLTVATFPADAALGEGVLFGCPALRHIELPENLSQIPDYAFTGSTGSNGYYTLPDGVESIGAFAYKDTDLGHIVLPPSLKSIGSYAMENTERLAIIDAGNVDAVPELGTDVWASVDKKSVKLLVPEEMTDDFRGALQWQDFELGLSGTDEIPGEALSVRAAFDGDILIVESSGSEIVHIDIFNEAGVSFFSENLRSFLISVPTGNLDLRIFIVRCILADGTVATAKLTR